MPSLIFSKMVFMLVDFLLTERKGAFPGESKACPILEYLYQASTKRDKADFRNFSAANK